jgi:hypothetical protein
MIIHTPEHIETRLSEIQAFLESTYDADEPTTLSHRITEVSIYMAEAGKLLGDAKYHLQDKMYSDLMHLIREQLPDYASANLQNAFVKSLCKDENRLVNYADRINATCTHQLDAMRTQISYLKSTKF